MPETKEYNIIDEASNILEEAKKQGEKNKQETVEKTKEEVKTVTVRKKRAGPKKTGWWSQ